MNIITIILLLLFIHYYYYYLFIMIIIIIRDNYHKNAQQTYKIRPTRIRNLRLIERPVLQQLLLPNRCLHKNRVISLVAQNQVVIVKGYGRQR
jgi:hypothetical protein